VFDQRLWTHERVPTMEFSVECMRIASGESWERHQRMLERVRRLNEVFEAETRGQQRLAAPMGVGIGEGVTGKPLTRRPSLVMSSTLKKRRKKMNKHKLRKRRKRDRGYGKA